MPDQSWAGIANTTIAEFITEEEFNILRNRKLPALLKQKGRISFDHGGDHMDWKVRYKRKKGSGYSDGDTVQFERMNREKTAKLDWRSYIATEGLTKWDKLKNKGKQAIVEVFSNKAKTLMEDVEEWFSEEFYNNGNNPKYIKHFHGIESFMAATPVAGNGAAKPTSTFAEINCTPGFYGGRWYAEDRWKNNAVSGWPNGKGDVEFDFWSPVIVDVGDNLFDEDVHTFEHNGLDAIRFGILKSNKSVSAKGQLDIIFINDEWYRSMLGNIDAKERIIASKESAPLVKLGFGDVVNFDGVDITTEYGMTPGTGYGFNLDQMELRSQQSQLFVPDGPNWNESARSFHFSIDCYGNIKWNPKFFMKFANLSHPELN